MMLLLMLLMLLQMMIIMTHHRSRPTAASYAVLHWQTSLGRAQAASRRCGLDLEAEMMGEEGGDETKAREHAKYDKFHFNASYYTRCKSGITRHEKHATFLQPFA